MLTINGNSYRLCLLDTNAVSEMVKHPLVLRHFFTWSLSTEPIFVPCYSIFTLLELRQNAGVYERFIKGFGPPPVDAHQEPRATLAR